ncbi:MAG TPA: metallophosphoesterase family protein [Candidatus Dormibacteraeota bacterium]
MLIAVVSDVHGNLVALRAVLEDLDRVRPDLVVHGGDLALHGSRPAECIDAIRERGWPGVLGNTDEMLSTGPPGALPVPVESIGWTVSQLGPDRLAWLREQPPEWRHGSETAVVHAAPGDVWANVRADAPDSELRRIYEPLGAAVAVFGHIHRPFLRVMPELTVANSGSVSLSLDGDRRASYLTVAGGVATVRRVAYDLERAIADVLASTHPSREWIAERLRRAGPVRA